jgi:hypothetical protein
MHTACAAPCSVKRSRTTQKLRRLSSNLTSSIQVKPLYILLHSTEKAHASSFVLLKNMPPSKKEVQASPQTSALPPGMMFQVCGFIIHPLQFLQQFHFRSLEGAAGASCGAYFLVCLAIANLILYLSPLELRFLIFQVLIHEDSTTTENITCTHINNYYHPRIKACTYAAVLTAFLPRPLVSILPRPPTCNDVSHSHKVAVWS